ncbi:MAG: 1-deoxy-D-xylulose-5-phosphate reductoisomerase [Hyphomicrobium sp.]|nr:1-deoxy-D-xylulose-5-phosphate reductoisomerase [Hyphomicrobium sp.]
MVLRETPAGIALGDGSCNSDASRRLSILGATGSIGESTLDLVGRSPDHFEVVALTAQHHWERLAELAKAHRAKLAVIGDVAHYAALKDALAGTGIEVAAGDEGLERAASEPADCVMAAIVGAAGLKPTFAAARQGRRVALANKECLVSAGEVFLAEIRRHGAELVPVDSEHSAALQSLAGAMQSAVEKIVLTASGGPFRSWSMEQLKAATPEQALKHPNWSMGAKITIDSATLMNKGLEIIEAYHLFPVDPSQLGAVVHPQSIVHCLVHYVDGSVLAQLGSPDMRTPIALALAWPKRMAAPTARLDLVKLGQLTFEAVDEARFPALGLARAALEKGGTAPAILNAANEVAVAAFLDRKLGFLDIASLVERTLDRADQLGLVEAPRSLDDVLVADQEGRRLARSVMVEF